MADSKPTTPRFRLTVPELNSLADRLLARASSNLFPGQPLMLSDMSLAGAAIRAFARKMAPDERLDIENGG
jgi:hypothetical protein